ncbi:MAG: RNA methyltransferase [Bacteroidetes bacterium]|nr:RNA methyltransferase [Bacteroidota bacterium]
MARVLYPESLEIPELQPYRVRKNNYELLRDGIFIAEGKRVVVRLLHSSLHTRSVLTTQVVWEWLEQNIPQGAHTDLPVYIAQREFLAQLVGYDVQQPILAIGEVPHDTQPETILAQKSSKCLFLATDHLMNPDNLGVIVRNCVAFSVDILIAGPSSASPYYRRAVRNSMGSIFHLPVCHTTSLTRILETLRDRWSFQIVAADPSGQEDLHTFRFSENVCIVVGNEASGISDCVLNVCTNIVRIPLSPTIDSFNVSNATAIFLWELWKQRTLAPYTCVSL